MPAIKTKILKRKPFKKKVFYFKKINTTYGKNLTKNKQGLQSENKEIEQIFNSKRRDITDIQV